MKENQEEKKVDWRKKHGMSYSNLYMRYHHIKERCNNLKNSRYKYYGGRGIKCLWKTFEEFYRDMGDSYKEGLTIDRIDVNGNYCKDNCKWITNLQQQNNKRNNNYITYNGVTKTMSEWSRELNIKYNTLASRLRRGFSVEKAFNL